LKGKRKGAPDLSCATAWAEMQRGAVSRKPAATRTMGRRALLGPKKSREDRGTETAGGDGLALLQAKQLEKKKNRKRGSRKSSLEKNLLRGGIGARANIRRAGAGSAQRPTAGALRGGPKESAHVAGGGAGGLGQPGEGVSSIRDGKGLVAGLERPPAGSGDRGLRWKKKTKTGRAVVEDYDLAAAGDAPES